MIVDSEPVIKLIPQAIHKKLFGRNYLEISPDQIRSVKHELEQNGLAELKDTSELIPLPIPSISATLPEWIDQIIDETYKVYFSPMERLRHLDLAAIELPHISPHYGWSKFINGEWHTCNQIENDGIIFDFETYLDDEFIMRPFMMAAIDTEGIIYSWLADVEKGMPEVVSFGDTVKLFVGHNSVSFDRRYVKEFYDFAHDKRMLDTFSLYSVLYGMSSDQIAQYRWARYQKPTPFKWVDTTTNGNLKDLSEFILGIEMDKSVREDLLKPKKVRGKYEVTPKSVIKNSTSEIWDYCLTDTFNTFKIFRYFIERILSYSTKIFLAGQLERSTLRINVNPKIKEKIANVVQYNNGQLKTINQIILKELDKKLLENDPYVISMLEGYVLKDWYERIYKSKKYQTYLLENTKKESDIYDVKLPESLVSLGWEYDDDIESKRASQKNTTLYKLRQVHQYLADGNETKIIPKTIKEWVVKLLKKPNEKIDENHISVAGKIAPVIIGLKWHGERLYIKGNTWGITYGDNQFLPLPHTKGKKNVGTPLSKDYMTLVTIGRFTADINLKQFFEIVSETGLWEKFNKRFNSIYIYRNTWLPEIVPSGTVTGRATGALAVVMANPDKPDKETGKSKRAGSEMKSWFEVEKGHVKKSADFSGQESEIFAALIDAITKWCGLNLFSCLVHAGNSDLKTDIHSFVARYLSGECGGDFPRDLAKNCNFANQFLCGFKRLGTMIFIALQGKMSEAECDAIAIKFQEFTRGEMYYGQYVGGIASDGFNRIKELAKEADQRCLLTGRIISDPLNARNNKSDLTTRVNFSIQGTGQGLVDICTIVTRYLAAKFEVPYNYCFLIHDEIHHDVEEQFGSTMGYFMQIGHLFSKALMYHKFGVRCMPLNKMFFETVEEDKYLRKSPMMSYLTPTNLEPIPLGKITKASECLPLPHILERIQKGSI